MCKKINQPFTINFTYQPKQILAVACNINNNTYIKTFELTHRLTKRQMLRMISDTIKGANIYEK